MLLIVIIIAASVHFLLANAENAILNVKSWQSLHDYPAFIDFPVSSVKEVLLKPNTAIGFSGVRVHTYMLLDILLD